MSLMSADSDEEGDEEGGGRTSVEVWRRPRKVRLELWSRAEGATVLRVTGGLNHSTWVTGMMHQNSTLNTETQRGVCVCVFFFFF